jgi:lipopolysaccharide biosynthesis glycosyltransferase
LFLRDSTEDDAVYEQLTAEALTHFSKKYGSKIGFSCVAVQSNYFKNFSRFHLTSATLQKLVIPAIFPSEDLCLSIDAGMIFGHKTSDFLSCVEKPSAAAITAFTTAASATLHESQLAIDHHALYPAGGILAFRPAIYNANDILNRCIETYETLQNQIIYGEQDIINFSLRDTELSDFAYSEKRIHIDLANHASWNEADHLVQTYLSKEYLYMKHVGVFKPWRRWVLSPAKSIYTHALSKLPEEIKLLTRHPKLACQHASSDKFSARYFEQQLQMYEEYLSIAIDKQMTKA